jgi:lysophospholipase L1-like esterase
MRMRLLPRRSVRSRQRVFGFLERKRDRERTFKRAILLVTALVIAVILRAVPWGRYLSHRIESTAGQVMRKALGMAERREQIDAEWKAFRRHGVEVTRTRVESYFAQLNPGLQKIWRYAGMDPEHGLIRWANYNWTITLSSKVFEADDSGRSYRFRPRTRSIWLTKVGHPGGVFAFYIVPDGPGLAEAIRGTTVVPLESSRQTTNSWGVRGPEPEPDAPLRGLILGDSYMQGMFIGDEETPPECLRRYLTRERKTRVSILNAGVMGYSPEQYYYTLLAFADRFRPHFVVVSACANDFGHMLDAVGKGLGDWDEGKHWLEKITEYCRSRRWPCLIVAAPFEASLLGRRKSGYFPGLMINALDVDSGLLLDPMDDFLDAHLKARVEAQRKGQKPEGSTLFNDAIEDHHFSAAGSEVWAEIVGRRLMLLLDDERLYRDTAKPH